MSAPLLRGRAACLGALLLASLVEGFGGLAYLRTAPAKCVESLALLRT